MIAQTGGWVGRELRKSDASCLIGEDGQCRLFSLCLLKAFFAARIVYSRHCKLMFALKR
jgi:hypothetical protein